MMRRWMALAFVASVAGIVLVPAPSSIYTGPEREVRISASRFEYLPAEITVQTGQRVILELTSTDVVHGIYLDGYELQMIADPGREETLEFTANRPGTFTFRCSVTCGPLHPFMVGKLHVVPNYKWIRLISGSALAVIAGVLWSQKRETQTKV
jgi:heme/copper-type cytochrome/quinol oxidase subunit 2